VGFCPKSWRFQGVGGGWGMTSTPWNGNSCWMEDLRQKCTLSGRGEGEYGLYNLSNVVENILVLNPKGLYLSVEKKRKEKKLVFFCSYTH